MVRPEQREGERDRNADDQQSTCSNQMPGCHRHLQGVRRVFVVAGGDDFLLHVGVPGLDALHAFLLDRLSKRREVTGFRTSVIFQQVSNPAPGLLQP
jgi:DNA-binding Lrp family transcriptional regulator